MTMITPSYLGETIEYSSLHACRSTLEDPTANRRRSESRAAALTERLADPGSRPYVSPVSPEVDNRVQRALAGLGEHDRELLLLIAWEGLRVNEAAEALGVRTNTLSVRLHRARQRLARALADEDVEIEMEVQR